MPSIKNNVITYDQNDWLAGMHPQSGVGNPDLVAGHDLATEMNPLRFLGNLCPAEVATSVTSASEITGIIKRIVYSNDRLKAYAVGDDLIHEIDRNTGEVNNDGTPYPYTIAGTTVEVEDIILYPQSGVEYAFVSWNDGTNGDIARVNTSVSPDTVDDDYFSTTAGGASLSKDYPHPMIYGDDGRLYVGNGNKISELDNATASDDVLEIPERFIIRSFAKLGNKTLVIFASTNTTSTNYDGEARAYFWDYLSETYYRAEKLWGNRVGGAFEYGNTIGCWSRGISVDEGSNTRAVFLNIYDGEKFVIVGQDTIGSNDEPEHGGTMILGDVIYGNSGGVIYAWGKSLGGFNIGLQKIGQGNGTTDGGAIASVFSGRILASSGTSTSGGLDLFSGSYSTSCRLQTSFAVPQLPLGSKGKVKRVVVELLKAITDGVNVSISLIDQDGTSTTVFAGNDTFSETINEYHVDSSGNPLPEFTQLQLDISYSSGADTDDAPIIKRVHIEYEPVDNLV